MKKIVFFGTPEFAATSLRRLLKASAESGEWEICAVVTMPDKPAGRGRRLLESDVKKAAVEAGLPVMQPANLKDPAFIAELEALGADLFIVIAFRMLPEKVWAMPPLGTFNLHASLLPKYRGAAPINRAVMNGDKKTGVTTFFLKHEIDTGDIIESREIDILDTDNVGDVHDRLMHLGADMVVNTVDDIFHSRVTPKPQPEGEFTPAPKIFAEDCIIDWNRPAIEVHNLVRGLSPYPGARAVITDTSGKETDIKIFETRLSAEKSAPAPGATIVSGHSLLASCADGWLEIISVQPAGKKRMDTSAYLLGYHPAAFSVKS